MDLYLTGCIYCGSSLDPLSRRTWRRVVGWERKATAATRKSGSDIACREPRDEYACEPCIAKLQAGLHTSQGSLI